MLKTSTASSISSQIEGLVTDFEETQTTLARAQGRQDAIYDKLKEATLREEDAFDEAEVLTNVLRILRSMEGDWRKGFHKSLETLVSDGLSVVFGEPLVVRIDDDERAGASTVNFKLVKDGVETGIMDAQGGGYVVVVAFLFRVLLILASVPPLRRILILDEPFAHVSPEFRQPLAEMIAELLERLDFQVIMVTQEREYVDAADVAYEFGIEGGVTTTRQIKGEV